MPGWLAEGFGLQMARLQAEEALLMVTMGQMASGAMDPKEAHRILRQWRTTADVQPQAMKPTVKDLRAMGIAVEFQ